MSIHYRRRITSPFTFNRLINLKQSCFEEKYRSKEEIFENYCDDAKIWSTHGQHENLARQMVHGAAKMSFTKCIFKGDFPT